MAGPFLADMLTGKGHGSAEPSTATVEILLPDDGRAHNGRGAGETERRSQFRISPACASHADRNFELRNAGGEPSGARVIGELIATKPAWKRRRASENDDELLQLLADGLGQWIQARGQGSRGEGEQGS